MSRFLEDARKLLASSLDAGFRDHRRVLGLRHLEKARDP
jgi:hypothetical protein